MISQKKNHLQREGKVGRTITGHKEKVQALSWHPFESQMLLTGCCDE